MQSNEPYIGSVRFFKNIIFLCCILGVLIPTGLALRWRSRAKTAEGLLAQNAVVLTGEEDEAASEAEAASAETEPKADSLDEQEPLSYQLLYPDFYAPTPLPDIEDAGKTIYLTFDDGPSDRTDEVLKILDEKGVKATFFVIGREDEASIQRIKISLPSTEHSRGIISRLGIYLSLTLKYRLVTACETPRRSAISLCVNPLSCLARRRAPLPVIIPKSITPSSFRKCMDRAHQNNASPFPPLPRELPSSRHRITLWRAASSL